jgi:hypothetical protein
LNAAWYCWTLAIAILGQDGGNLVFTLVYLGEALRRLGLWHRTPADVRDQLIVGEGVAVIGLTSSDDSALNFAVVVRQIISDQEAASFVICLLRACRSVGCTGGDQGAGSSADQCSTPIATAGDRPERRSSGRAR